MTDIRLEIETRGEGGRVATVTVDNVSKLNILDPSGIAALERAFDGLAADETLRVVVLRGAGNRAFIGGADIAPWRHWNPRARAPSSPHSIAPALRSGVCRCR